VGTERGLLGIAVDPEFPARPYVYIHCNDSTALAIRITRLTVGGDLAFTGNGNLAIDPASRYDVLTAIPDNDARHNGGTVRFGPDGMLYASIGDDASSCAAQDTSSLRGVILRIDVSGLPAGAGGPPAFGLITPADNPFPSNQPRARLIWACGLRNPFRFHIDPLDGNLYIADVGESHWEEINRATGGGLDFGWPHFEGATVFDASCLLPLPATAPVYAYDRSGSGSAAFVSGGVYRAPRLAAAPFPLEYNGDYFFADYYAGFLRRLKYGGGNWSIAPPVAGQQDATNWATGLVSVNDFAIGPDGGLWYCLQFVNFVPGSGQIRRIVNAVAPPPPPPPVLPPPIVTFSPPYPSPAPGAVHLTYHLPLAATVTIEIFDLRGRKVRALLPPTPEAALSHDHVWDGLDDAGRAAPAGLYIARLSADGAVRERRIALLR
jgi:hypothetical protein